MSKALKKTIATVIAAVMLLGGACAAFAGCGTTGDDNGPVNTDKTVYSNGGTVVQYGDHVYFVNGIADYTDESGSSNLEGGVIKGGIYRARINWDRPVDLDAAIDYEVNEAGNLTAEEYEQTAARSTTLFDVLDFEYELKDYIQLGEYTIGTESGDPPPTYSDANGVVRQNFVPTAGGASEYGVAVEQVVGKKVGTSGYDGGMWIYDGYIYFASPDNTRNSDGEVEDDRTTFWAYDIERDLLSKLYTATEINNAMPYAFYKSEDSVYLTTFENYYADAEDEELGVTTGYIVVNRISGGRVTDTYELVDGVTDVYFPTAETYDPDDTSPDGADDFVYFTRDNDSSDNNPTGVTLEMISPYMEEGQYKGNRFTVASADNGDISVAGLEGGYLYFTLTGADGKTQMQVSSLFEQLNKHDENYNDETCDAPPMVNVDPVICSDTSEYTTIIPVDQFKDIPCFMGANADGIYRVTADGRTRVYNGTITLIGYYGGRIYCSLETEDTEESEDDEESEGTVTAFVSNSAFEPFTAQTARIHSIGITPTTEPFSIDFFTINYDAVEGSTATGTEVYVSYFANYTATAANYMYINKVSGSYIRSAMNMRLGEVMPSEETPIVCYDHHCLNFRHDHSSWDDYTEDEETEDGTTTDGGVTM